MSKDLSFLLKLVDDPDPTVFGTVRSEIINAGTRILPDLESYLLISESPLIIARLQELISDISFEQYILDWVDWFMDEPAELFESLRLLNQFNNADLQRNKLNEQLDVYYKEIWIELHDKLTALEKIRILNHILFQRHKFEISSNYPLKPSSFFLFEAHHGKPLTLSAFSLIYLYMCRKLNLPVYSALVNEELFLCYLDSPIREIVSDKVMATSKPLFFISLIHQGEAVSLRQLEEFVRRRESGQIIKAVALSDKILIKIILTQLKEAYANDKNALKEERVSRILQLWDNQGRRPDKRQ